MIGSEDLESNNELGNFIREQIVKKDLQVIEIKDTNYNCNQ